MTEDYDDGIILKNMFDEADESLKDFIFRILTDYISLEDIAGDIVAIIFCKQEKISNFQGIVLTRLSFNQKFQMLEQILKIEKPHSQKASLIEDVRNFVNYRNMISHRKRGLSISKDGVTVFFDRSKDNKILEIPVTETKRDEIEKLGKSCLDELVSIREEMKKKFYKR